MDLKRNSDKLVIAEADMMLILDIHVCGYLTRGVGKLASNPCPLSCLETQCRHSPMSFVLRGQATQ